MDDETVAENTGCQDTHRFVAASWPESDFALGLDVTALARAERAVQLVGPEYATLTPSQQSWFDEHAAQVSIVVERIEAERDQLRAERDALVGAVEAEMRGAWQELRRANRNLAQATVVDDEEACNVFHLAGFGALERLATARPIRRAWRKAQRAAR